MRPVQAQIALATGVLACLAVNVHAQSPGSPNVTVGGQQMLRVGDIVTCPDGSKRQIVRGSPNVLINGLPAARRNDVDCDGKGRDNDPSVLINSN